MKERLTVKQKRELRRSDPALADRHSRRFWAAVMLVSFVFIAVLLDSIRCSSDFIIQRYEFVTDRISAPVRIVMVSDLHESEFGEGNERLINAVRDIGPDLILCAGDMITRNSPDERMSIGIDFMAALTDIAPVYMSLGNHETIYTARNGRWVLDAFEASGVRILDTEYADVSAAGQVIRVGGVSSECFNTGLSDEEYESSEKYRFLNDMSGSGHYSILLCHRPSDYRRRSDIKRFEDRDIDLVLSGHTHGGLWQIPFIGSLYLPQQGLFPDLDRGLKRVGKADMIIGAGLGTEKPLFRFNDPCELVLITLNPAK